MSCRRSDRNNMMGCAVGDVALRGCCRGCCPYDDEDWESENRYQYTEQGADRTSPENASFPDIPGRKGLFFHRCMYHYSPKFICPKPTCRRNIKPFYDPDMHEYDVDKWGKWKIRPLKHRNEEYADAVQNHKQIQSSHQNPDIVEKRRRKQSLLQRIWDVDVDSDSLPDPLTPEELEELKSLMPDEWWVDVGTLERPKKCPICGDAAVKVGPNFRIPKKADEKAWKRIEKMITDGTDMEAELSFCPTIEEHWKLLDKAHEDADEEQRVNQVSS